MDEKRSRRRKIYCLQSEEHPQVQYITKSFYSFVVDNKEVVKVQNLLANCTKSVKAEVNMFIKRWKPYYFLWKNERSARELMGYGLMEFESSLRCLSELDAQLLVETNHINLLNCIAVSTEKLKFGLAIEIKGFIQLYFIQT